MSLLYPVDSVRRAEAALLAHQSEPDQLMREAARHVAATAVAMLDRRRPGTPHRPRVLLLVGTGGNGGDALYAGALLLERGISVAALTLGSRTYPGAAEAFLDAGGIFLDQDPDRVGEEAAWGYHLVIDGIAGLGGHAGLSDAAAWLADDLLHAGVPVLAIDVPSGLPADTGQPPPPRILERHGTRRTVAGFLTAHATLTFGALRPVHAAHTACGQVLCADLCLRGAPSLSEALKDSADPSALLYRAVPPVSPLDPVPGEIYPLSPLPLLTGELEPSGTDDKYSSGVVGILAGSAAYPGAGVLAAQAAVRATPSMVRYVGGDYRSVVAALPEVVGAADLTATGRVQAWVVGPGRGTDEEAAEELTAVLGRPEPVLCDADALTLLTRNPQAQRLVRQRPRGSTVLTPHAGEFARLRRGLGLAESAAPPWMQAAEVARELGAVVLLKGRFTSIARENVTIIIDTGHSWAATPGSGDVLAGLLGAWLARMPDRPHEAAALATHLHAVSARIAAETPEGPAPTSASEIAAAIPTATARGLRAYRAAREPWR
ncbi:NAD(P)H-hydrate epimerase [Corynebacterium sp. zg-331]|uniref:bifunctional ADP-dependent NAD(P)H-hydrate dehydratase/NAD(P)H-hydrate epimerase n=1 Tax=unclassified Corynebacterium TaxID=2624378 RepID=UPI00128B226F|nr:MULTISPECIES: bifunctional ADP-dependent NAD(P)H-hydrate dehydratase/NAD(P)H-hydrate epimerase [unclassified Corynebacterium]MBC3186515.1 NAD(P)H-hydrate epimerase [Corynebacterium sp. zg-331]MPV53000.1 NAD(P)H-hydrate epimerase [Corynebacterium sp. zg331]